MIKDVYQLDDQYGRIDDTRFVSDESGLIVINNIPIFPLTVEEIEHKNGWFLVEDTDHWIYKVYELIDKELIK